MYSTTQTLSKHDILINKIFKFLPSSHKIKIKKVINSNISEKDKLTQISNLVKTYIETHKVTPDLNRQDFIVGNIKNYLSRWYPYLLTEELRIVDIGGGNGNVISKLRTNLCLDTKKENFICLETLNDWTESYDFNNTNITYKFWDNKEDVDIESNSVDIILCMVSLHHMTNETLRNLLVNIKRILKKDGKIFIKEHNKTNISEHFILWEHHLYHILDCAYKNTLIDVDEYRKTSIYNFKRLEQWNIIFSEYGFNLTTIRNRFLDDRYAYDYKNCSELYWAVFSNS